MEKSTAELLKQEIALILNLDPARVRDDQPLHELGMDSMSFVELLVFIEKQFKINLVESGLSQQDFSSIAALSRRITQEKAKP